MKGLGIHSLTKKYGDLKVLQGISFHQSKGEILALLGPSGSGKTTLLEIIAGLVEPDSGDCTWDGKTLLGIPPHLRNFGLMFQEYVLFPHKNVFENISFGLKMADQSPEDRSTRVKQVLKMVGLPGFETRDISTLSGGEQQRVALARSLAPEPRLVMLDEPLGALDRTIRERLIGEIRVILKKAGQTALYVTHDQEEAFTIADRVVILGEGTSAQIGTPQEIYYHPSSPYVAMFLGMTNFMDGSAENKGESSTLKTPLDSWEIKEKMNGLGQVLLRPDRVIFGSGQGSQFKELSGVLEDSAFSGQNHNIKVQFENYQFKFVLSDPGLILPQVGKTITLSFDPNTALHFFPKDVSSE